MFPVPHRVGSALAAGNPLENSSRHARNASSIARAGWVGRFALVDTGSANFAQRAKNVKVPHRKK